MAIRRYARTPIIRGGQQYGTSDAIRTIRQAAQDGRLRVDVRTLQGSERLDILAGQVYSDPTGWWVIAAASGIGWGLQVPPGTRLVIPTDLSQVIALVG